MAIRALQSEAQEDADVIVKFARPRIDEFAQLVLIVSGRKPTNAHETALQETIRRSRVKTLLRAWFLERDLK
jgi:hypothetical protein